MIMPMASMVKYVIISPVRNEERFIEKTIFSVISQTLIPVEWVIMNDGSTDRTKEIIEKYSGEFNWIKCISIKDKGFRAGVGPSEAFNEGFRHISKDFDFLVNLDGDITFEQDYFSMLLQKFIVMPKLGIASGKMYYLENNKMVLYRTSDSSVIGASKVYRKKCFEDIGGRLDSSISWDLLDELKAQISGWETRSFPEVAFIHHKRIGSMSGNQFKMYFNEGKILYFYGYHPLYFLAKSLYRGLEKPYFVRTFLMLLGFLTSFLKRTPQFDRKDLINFLRKKQIEKLKAILSFRRNIL